MRGFSMTLQALYEVETTKAWIPESNLPYNKHLKVKEISYFLPVDLSIKVISVKTLNCYVEKIYEVTSSQPLAENHELKALRALGLVLKGQITGKVIQYSKNNDLHVYTLQSVLDSSG